MPTQYERAVARYEIGKAFEQMTRINLDTKFEDLTPAEVEKVSTIAKNAKHKYSDANGTGKSQAQAYWELMQGKYNASYELRVIQFKYPGQAWEDVSEYYAHEWRNAKKDLVEYRFAGGGDYRLITRRAKVRND